MRAHAWSLELSPFERPAHAEHGGAAYEALGLDFARLDRVGEIVDADVLDAWYDPSPTAVSAVQEHLAWLLRTSPPTQAEGLRDTIADVRGLPRECVLVGGGTSSLAYMALPRIVRPGDRPLLLDPMYGEYAHWFESVEGVRCSRYLAPEASGFRPDLDAYLRELALADVGVLVNPNSPTGVAVDLDFLRAALDQLPRFGLLIVDETYSDFAGDGVSVERWVEEEERLVVLKSLSKFWALSGLRVGYVAAHASVIAKLEAYNPPWSVGLVAQLAAVEALRDGGYYAAMAQQTRALREKLAEDLAALPGLRVLPSVTNFLMLLLDAAAPSPAEVVARCRAYGVYLRDCTSLGRRDDARWLRTAVKDAPRNARIVEALRAALG